MQNDALMNREGLKGVRMRHGAYFHRQYFIENDAAQRNEFVISFHFDIITFTWLFVTVLAKCVVSRSVINDFRTTNDADMTYF